MTLLMCCLLSSEIYDCWFVNPRMWQRNVSKAFRRSLISVEHLDLSWVVFAAEGLYWVSQHLGMPFGATSAVSARYRGGQFLAG